jgi:hypothetical protein
LPREHLAQVDHERRLSAGPLNYVLVLLMVVLGKIGVGEIEVFKVLTVWIVSE